MAPQMPPAARALAIMMTISSQLGTLSPSRIMQAAVARPPMSTWPSPPMFQNLIRKAGVTARETHSSSARYCMVFQVLRFVPKAPAHMVL